MKNKSPKINKNVLHVIIGIAALTLIIGTVGYFSWLNFQKPTYTPPTPFTIPVGQTTNPKTLFQTKSDFVPDIKNEAFIATENDTLNITLFNPSTNEILVSKKISIDAQLAPSDTNAYGANASVQYNPKTKEIFFSTQGYAEYDGSCINKDGTCFSRMYKIGLRQTKPIKLFESDAPPANWIVNNFDNTLLTSTVKDGIQTLKKISGENGEIIFTVDRPIQKEISAMNFVLSKDGSHIYQVGILRGNRFHTALILRTIDYANGKITEEEIFKGEDIESETNISPDNQYLAFYAAKDSMTRLFIYERSTQKFIDIPHKFEIKNLNLKWSGDSRKLLFMPENGTSYYDMSTGDIVPISKNEERTSYAYAWGPSTNHIVYLSRNAEINIKNIQTGRVINTGVDVKHATESGISWH